MAARKPVTGIKVNISNPAEEQAAKFIRGMTPWIVWLGGIPLAVAVFRITAIATRHVSLVTGGLALATVILTWVTLRTTHARGWGRFHHGLNTFLALAIVTFATWEGPGAWHGDLLIGYAILGMTGCLAWNIRYSQHSDGVEDVLTHPRHASGRKRIDLAYLVRVMAGRAPVIRAGAEKAGKVIPGVVAPWREPAKGIAEVPEQQKAITSADHVDSAGAESAARMWLAIRANWRDLAAHKVPDLNGARIKALDVKPWRIRTEIILIRGVQTPRIVADARELLASQNALPLSSILVKPNPRDHHRVFVDFVLEDVLGTVRHWTGPTAAGKSIADAPVRFGIYEDRVYAESWETAISAEMSKRLGVPEQNLAHPISEGMTGSGKSNLVRITIADGATRTDVVDWAIDPVKKFQTLGCVAGALDWFATTPAEARAMVRFLADSVIPERANYLGMHGYDNWEPGCGLPLLRVTIEEGGIIANELEKLDATLNSARSSGVKIRASFQRAHHAVVDTNVRAAFGESLSFGVRSSDDIFVMDDELREAGADPSLWGDKQPGMLYRSAASIPFERQLMPVRGFKAEPQECTQVIAAHAGARDARVAQDCPDWAAMLASLDANGVYAKRTTGAAVLAQMATAAQRRNGRAPVAPPPGEAPLRGLARMADDEEIVEAEIVPDDGRMSDEPDFTVPDYPPDDDTEEPVSMDELDLPPELREAVAGDDGIDPRRPVPPPGPDEVLSFGRPAAAALPRDDALRVLRGYLMQHGDGWEFAPRDLYDELCKSTGRSASWIRNEVSTTLAAEGIVEHDRMEGTYRVSLSVRPG